MRKSRIVVGAVLVGALTGVGFLAAPLDGVYGQAKKKAPPVSTKAEKAAKPEMPGQGPAKNPEKGFESQTRAGANRCDVVFENNTDWWIHRVYIDRRYVGQMAPRGKYILDDVAAGPTVIYAEADFTDGSVRKWGPRTFPCPEWTTYTWTLTP